MSDASATIRVALDRAVQRLKKADIPSPLWEARFLLCESEGITSTDIILTPDRPLSNPGRYENWISRRAEGVPFSRLTGNRDFWGLRFQVSDDTLDPRQDSEVLVREILTLLPDGTEQRLADIGTGTGCLLLSLLWERPAWRGIGVDLSPGAVLVATANAAMLGLSDRADIRQGCWLDPLSNGSVDVLISNPPYIGTVEIAGLDRAVREFDPYLALDGGPDGLDAYRAIIGDAGRVLHPGGWIALEVGWDQGGTVPALLVQAGFDEIRVVRDDGNRDRVVLARMMRD